MKFRWRDYRTEAGRSPVGDFIGKLDEGAAAEVAAAMIEVRQYGTRSARHLRGDIWEVRASSSNQALRILFAPEGKKGHIFACIGRVLKENTKNSL